MNWFLCHFLLSSKTFCLSKICPNLSRGLFFFFFLAFSRGQIPFLSLFSLIFVVTDGIMPLFDKALALQLMYYFKQCVIVSSVNLHSPPPQVQLGAVLFLLTVT